jgi:hypothetical protein
LAVVALLLGGPALPVAAQLESRVVLDDSRTGIDCTETGDWDLFMRQYMLAARPTWFYISSYEVAICPTEAIPIMWMTWYDALGDPFRSMHNLVVERNGDVLLANRGLTIERMTGRVGVGTENPQGNLHIAGAPTDDIFAGVGPDLVVGPAFNFGYAGSTFGRGAGFFNVRPDAGAVAPNPALHFMTNDLQRMVLTSQGRLGLGVANPNHPLELASGARLTAGGVWTNASSRAGKTEIAGLPWEDARAALLALEPVTFAARADPAERHVGFIAEDVPALVATADRTGLSPMDLAAVLTRVVQEQARVLAELRARLGALEHASR